MQKFSLSVAFYLMLIGSAGAAYLPTVDVSRGGISARAAFGEEIAQPMAVEVAPLVSKTEKTEKKVVARSARKVADTSKTTNVDILKPLRPSSDLWARQTEKPLRMPRMDEIAVLDFNDSLPEESLNYQDVEIAQNKKVVARDLDSETLNELRQLRAEVNRLATLQESVESRMALARPMPVETPLAGESDVKPATKKERVNVRREVVPYDNKKDVVARVAVNKVNKDKVASSVDNEMSKMLPTELKKAFKKTYLSSNKHLSTYEAQAADDYDIDSDMSLDFEGFDATRDLSEIDSGIRPMEIKISFLNGDSGLSRENYNLLSETAAIVVNNPKRAVQISIPESATKSKSARKLAARRLAIVEQVLRDTGVSDRRIVPVLSQRDDDVFVLRVISGDAFESLTKQKYNMFGDSVAKKTYKSMSW